MILYLRKLLYIIADKKKQLVFLIFLFVLTSLLESFGIGLIGPFITLATNPKFVYQNGWSNWVYSQLGFNSEVQFISLFGLVIVGILYFKAFLSFSIQRYIFKFGFSQQADLRLKLMHAYLTAPYIFHLNRNTANLIQNVVNETHNFANGILMPLLGSVSNFSVIVALLILLLRTDIVATASILLALLLVFLLLYRFKDKVARWGREAHEADIEIIRIINHGLGGFKETRLIGCEPYFEKQMAEQAGKFKLAVTASNAFSLLPRYTLEPLLITFLVGFTIAYLASNHSSESLTATLGVFGMASIRLLPAASNFMQAFANIRNFSYILDKLHFDLREIESITVDHQTNYLQKTDSYNSFKSKKSHEIAMSFRSEIVINKITYRYPDILEPAIKELSLVLKKGQSIGLIGKSGAGKTTLVDIILGLLTPESGSIEVDGVSVDSNLRSWQNLIGYIPQAIFLIDDTIKRNIAFGVTDEQIDQQRLYKAIQAAQLTELINQLPDGINTVVGERGVRLSGGQRQRVGIARALYFEKEILVLDEATAALDNETESLVSEAIKSLSGTKTMIIIAHRLSTIEHCDRIYSLEKGQVVKSGTYQEVVLEKQVSHR